MQTNHVINMTGFSCPARANAAFRSCYEKLLSVSPGFCGLVEVSGYELQLGNGVGTVHEYPAYLTVHQFQNYRDFEQWNDSVKVVAANREASQRFATLGVEMLWGVQYECIGTWQETPSSSVIKMVGMQPTPETEVTLNEWYSVRHIQDEIQFPGVRGAARHRIVSTVLPAIGLQLKQGTQKYPQYLAVYYYPDVATAEAWETSPQRAAAYADVSQLLKETGIVRLWRARYVPFGKQQGSAS